MNKRIDFLKRKAIGSQKCLSFRALFASVGLDSSPVLLEDADIIAEEIRKQFSTLQYTSELLKSVESGSSFLTSLKLKKGACYIFTDDFQFCGMYFVTLSDALDNVFYIAENDENGTCFIADKEFGFFLKVNYYDHSHRDFPNTFEVEIKSKPML